jgi:pimeloyl-ACP methyl ester carboxylesterase
MVSFERRPGAGPTVSEFRLPVADTVLSGLLAEPAVPEEVAGVIVALHGAGMHAGYFDSRAAPRLSLLELGRQHGYTVWSVDRPGIGASADLPDDRITLAGQAALLLDALDEFSKSHPTGAGFLLVGHSYGLKVAWAMAAEPKGRTLLGVEGSGAGVRYGFDWNSRHRQRSLGSDPGDMWGPPVLYPEGTRERSRLPLHRMPPVQVAEGERWPDDIRAMGPRIRVPLRLTFGQHETLWPIDPASLDEIRTVLCAAPSLTIEIEPCGAHNLSLGWAACPYHLKVLAFAESCRLGRRFG